MVLQGELTNEHIIFLKNNGFNWLDSLELWACEVVIHHELKIRSFVDPEGEMGTAVLKGYECEMEKYFTFTQDDFPGVYETMRRSKERFGLGEKRSKVS
jgi:hypothetical protein